MRKSYKCGVDSGIVFGPVVGGSAGAATSAQSGVLITCADTLYASDGGSLGDSSAGRLRGRPPALLEGPWPSTLLFFQSILCLRHIQT